MISSVPAVIAWPVIVTMAVLLVGRYWLCRTNSYDTYYNNLMAFVLVAQLLREGSVEDILSRGALMSPTTAQQMAFVAMVFASTELIGFTMLWNGLPPEQARRQHRYYRAAAIISCICFLVAATRARLAGQTLEVSGGWDAIWAWVFYLIILLVMAARFVWMFANELKRASNRRERLLAASGLTLGTMTALGCLEALISALTDQLGWTSTVMFRLWLHGFEYFGIAVFVYVLGAIPLVVRLLSRLGLDPVSRSSRKLQPLWRAMTSVVPESRFNIEQVDPGGRITTLALHQTVIEIRDAFLRLRPYFGEVDPREVATFLSTHSVPTRRCGAATQAFQLACAARARSAGLTPKSPSAVTVLGSPSTTLDGEVAALVKVAKWWTLAWAATQRRTAPIPSTKAGTPG